jgi:hypothetical protein
MRGNLLNNNVTPEMLAQLPFIEGELQVVMARGKKVGNIYKLYNLTKENMEKAKKLLAGDLMPTLPKKSRVYVLPNCIYTQVQIRELCKFHGFTITHDISRADLFVGNKNTILAGMDKHEFPDALGSLETRLHKYEMKDDFAKAAFTTRYPDFLEPVTDTNADVYFSRQYYNNIDAWSTLYGTDDYYTLISGEAVEVLHRILSGKVPVVNEDNIFNSIERLVIDDEMYNTLSMMFDASMDDKKIACELLFNADYDKSYYNIYKLIKNYYYTIDSYMTRNNREIISRTFPMREIYNSDFKRDLDRIYTAGYLTEEIYFNILYHQATQDTKNIHDSLGRLQDFFAVDLFVKKSYEEYIESKKPKVNEENAKSVVSGTPV